MDNEKGNGDNVFEISMKDLLRQVFKDGERNVVEKGAIDAINEIRTNMLVLVRVSKDKTLSSMLMDMNEMFSHLAASRDKVVKKLSKEELQKSEAASGESIEIASAIIDSLEDFDFIENNMVQGEKFSEKIKQTIIILPSDEREKIFSELAISIQRGFNGAMHKELPKLMENFFENILAAIERGSIEDMQEILETEKLKWHSFGRGFP